MRSIYAVVVAGFVALTCAPGASAQELIQPGAYHETSVGACTLSFVYSGPSGQTLLGTAAHCVDRVGETVRDIDGVSWGKVAFIGDADDTAEDFAFIAVDSEDLSRVRNGVKGHPQYPTGFTRSSETALGDVIQQSGYGLGFDLTAPTREQRKAVLTFDDASIWGIAGLMNFGDSGGPLIHVRTGKALGIESRICIGVCTDEGPTVEGILNRAAAARFPVTLRTV